MTSSIPVPGNTETEFAGVIDGRCHCANCVARTEDIYRMVGGCLNCMQGPFLLIYRAGDNARSLECPVCRNPSVSVRRAATADEIPVSS